MTEQMEGQMSIFDLDIWSGKTYPKHSAATREKISERFLKKPQKWQKGMPAYLDLRGGRWPSAGCIMGNGWSIAWRVHDAQFWGVPQRRKRISLVADFGGSTAPEILFERKGLSGDFAESGKERQGAAEDAGRGITQAGRAISFQERAGKPGGGKVILIQNERTGALSTLNNQSVCAVSHGGFMCNADESGIAHTLEATDYKDSQAVVYGISAYDSNAMKSGNPNSGVYEAETARTLDLNGGSPACNQGGMAVVCLEGNEQRDSHKGDGYKESETMYTLNTVEQHAVCIENHPADSRVKISEDGVCQTLSGRMGTGGGNVPMVMESSSWDGGQVSPTLTANNAGGSQRMPDKENFNAVLTYGLDRASFNQGINAKYDFAVDEEKIGTQVARGPGAVLPWTNSVVRRLTPLECERLQGFPNHWTDIGDWVDSKGKTHKGDSDSPRYKALGNSIALPFWQWMAERMVRYISHTPTMASLFDGIGGFPLSFSRCGCVLVWASEIEEFPIAVTKRRFPDESENV